MPNNLSKEALALLKQYNLSDNPEDGDVFFNHQFKIITRQGIDKIMTAAKVAVEDIQVIFIDPYEVMMMGVFSLGENRITTTASASVDRVQITKVSKSRVVDGEQRTMEEVVETLLKKGSVKQKPAYLPEMCEKRLNSRGVLKLTGFYDIGFYGQDESDDFSGAIYEARKEKPKGSVTAKMIK